MAIAKTQVTTVILAGGLSTRMGGSKGLKLLQGKAMIGWVLDAVRESSAEVLINVNEKPEAYAQFACRVIADQMPDWPGPLAGLQAALGEARSEYILTVPCDTPLLPHNLVMKLLDALIKDAAEVAVAKIEGYRQPTIALYRKSVLPKLNAYLGSGKRKVNDWLDMLKLSEVEFEHARDFDNINTQKDLERVELEILKTKSNSGQR